MAQIDWAVKMEMAATVTDILLQRTQLYYRDEDQGLSAIERVAEHMAVLLDWDDEMTDEQIARYRHDVEWSRRWRSDDADGT